jgi:hypothetical protein
MGKVIRRQARRCDGPLKEGKKQENKYQETRVELFEIRPNVYFLDDS